VLFVVAHDWHRVISLVAQREALVRQLRPSCAQRFRRRTPGGAAIANESVAKEQAEAAGLVRKLAKSWKESVSPHLRACLQVNYSSVQYYAPGYQNGLLFFNRKVEKIPREFSGFRQDLA
jgi:hypothetical protein